MGQLYDVILTKGVSPSRTFASALLELNKIYSDEFTKPMPRTVIKGIAKQDAENIANILIQLGGEAHIQLDPNANYCGGVYYLLQNLNSILAKAEQQNKYVPHCPTCGSANIKKLSTTKRITHGAMFGLFSKTARSQWECKNCGNKW